MTAVANLGNVARLAATNPKPFNPSDHLMKLTGKDYLPVAARIAWINAEFGHDVSMATDLVRWREWDELDARNSKPNAPVYKKVYEATFKCVITFPNGHTITAHGSESSKDFGDFLEKAETKSVGRALGMAGYGTLAAPEFDESATISRAEAAKAGRDATTNTWENTRGVDAAQDLSALQARKAGDASSTTSMTGSASSSGPTSNTPGATSPTSSPTSPKASTPAPVAVQVQPGENRDQMINNLIQISTAAQSAGGTFQETVNATIAAANLAAGVSRASELPTPQLQALVADLLEAQAQVQAA